MTTCTRILEFDAAHRVLRHESKCRTLHGHRYKVEITCSAPDLDTVGRVVDFGVIKALVGGWIDKYWDHTTLVNDEDMSLIEWCGQDALSGHNRHPYIFPGNPTAENIASYLLDVAQDLFRNSGSPLVVSQVRVWETPNCYADAYPPDTVPSATST